MFWVIRWTEPQTESDRFMVVEASARATAEAMALKRDLAHACIVPATARDIVAARKAKVFHSYSARKSRFRCFGERITPHHVACLLLCGLWTIGTLLQVSGLLRAIDLYRA